MNQTKLTRFHISSSKQIHLLVR